MGDGLLDTTLAGRREQARFSTPAGRTKSNVPSRLSGRLDCRRDDSIQASKEWFVDSDIDQISLSFGEMDL